MVLTPAEVTLITALGAPLLGAPIGALITIIATSRTNQANRELQKELAEQDLVAKRALARDERRYRERASLYSEAVILLERIPNFVLPERWMPPGLNAQPASDEAVVIFDRIFRPIHRELNDLTGRFETVADKGTRAAWADLLDRLYQVVLMNEAQQKDGLEFRRLGYAGVAGPVDVSEQLDRISDRCQERHAELRADIVRLQAHKIMVQDSMRAGLGTDED